MNKIKQSILESKRCKKCGGFLEPKYGDYHPICKPNDANYTEGEKDE